MAGEQCRGGAQICDTRRGNYASVVAYEHQIVQAPQGAEEDLRDNMNTLEQALNAIEATTTELTRIQDLQALAEKQNIARR